MKKEHWIWINFQLQQVIKKLLATHSVEITDFYSSHKFEQNFRETNFFTKTNKTISWFHEFF